jgi:hypothetical protein
VVRAHRRLAYVKHLRTEALAGGDAERERELSAEIHWLAPFR